MTPERIEQAARQWIGTPFHHQASVMGVGCDCLGFVRGVYRQCGGAQSIAIPNYGLFWSERGQFNLRDSLSEHLHLIPRGDAMVGDILLLRMRFGGSPRHLAVLSDAGHSIIHCDSKHGVTEVPFAPMWSRLCAATFRFKEVRT